MTVTADGTTTHRLGEPPAGSWNAATFFVHRHLEEGRGERLAFRDPTRSLTYAALAERVARFADGLTTLGVQREQRIALLLLDTVDFPVAFWGALHAGVVPVAINTLLPAEAWHTILADSRAVAAVVSPALWPRLAEVRPRLPALRHVIVTGQEAPDDTLALEPLLAVARADRPPADTHADEVAFWLYSSGSTGRPKGVRHVHASLWWTAALYGCGVLNLEQDDLCFSAAKLFFAYGLGNAMTFPLAVGAASVLWPERPTPEAVLAILREHQPTLFFGVPTLYAALLAQPELGPGAGSNRLRLCVSAGEALPREVGERWRERVGVDILDGIGSTEMLHIFLSNRPDALRYGTSGRPVPGYECRVVDEDGRDVRRGELGELWVRGPSAAEGYWCQREKSRRTFLGEWTRTGDRYRVDEEGWYHYAGRADDMFKVSGIWVSPFEVESALMAHPAVLEAAVIGRADANGLIKPKAFVVLREGRAPSAALADELKAHVKAVAGPWKYPRWIEFVDQLPKTATGKIQRFRLRERERAATAGERAG